MALPVPVGRQKEVLALPAQGHIVVLGTAGSGKTTLAILRAAYLAHPGAGHQGSTLLVTFNRALVAYLRHVSDGALRHVTVETYHKFARGYLASRGRMSQGYVCDPRGRAVLIRRAVASVASSKPGHQLFEKPLGFFCEEIQWISQHDIRTLEQYQEAERVGRGSARLAAKHRPVMFQVLQAYRQVRAERGLTYDWDDIAIAACSEFDRDDSERRYRHVVVDEGQDFSPVMIRSLVKAVPQDGSVTFFGDVAQQIYGHRVSWRRAGLNITKPWEFRENYRNTQQIARLGLAIFKNVCPDDVDDFVEPTSPKAEGPLPTLVRCSSVAEEVAFVVSQAAQAARRLSVAILLRGRKDEDLVVGQLPAGSQRLDRNMTTWRSGPGIYYGTYHAAKGLEFDMVILPFCSEGRLPDPELIDTLGPDEAATRDGRLLYVGVTRARTQLLITFAGKRTRLLPRRPGLYGVVHR